MRLPVLMLAGAVLAVSAASLPAQHAVPVPPAASPGASQRVLPSPSPSVFVRLSRLAGPTDTLIVLARDGRMLRVEGKNLEVFHSGDGRIAPDRAASLVDEAASLRDVTTSDGQLREADRYWIVGPGGRIVSCDDTELTPELRRWLGAVFGEAGRLQLAPYRGHFVRAVPVDADRLARLRAAGVDATLIASLDSPRQALVREAVASLHRPRRLSAADFSALLRLLGGGREPFVRVDDSTWYQLELWAPP